MSTEATSQQTTASAFQEASLLDRIAAEQAQAATRYQPVMSVDDSIKRYKAIEKFVHKCMAEGIDYGKPAGFPAESKPFLYKPGAQKLCAFFGYVPRYEMMTEIEDWTGAEHNTEPLYYYKFRCVLTKNEDRVGEGIGSCNSWEAKYRYRLSAPKCPTCGVEAIIAGKAEYGGGFFCFKKKGGCGSKYADTDARILDQPKGRVPNPEIPDVINTVQKQAEKRAYVEATLSATGASAFFSQDEDAVKPPAQAEDPQGPPRSRQQEPKKESGPPPPKKDDRPVPEELKDAVAKLRLGDMSVINTTTMFLRTELATYYGDSQKLDDAAAVLRKDYPKPQPIPYEAMITMWLDLWKHIESRKFAAEANAL